MNDTRNTSVKAITCDPDIVLAAIDVFTRGRMWSSLEFLMRSGQVMHVESVGNEKTLIVMQTARRNVNKANAALRNGECLVDTPDATCPEAMRIMEVSDAYIARYRAEGLIA